MNQGEKDRTLKRTAKRDRGEKGCIRERSKHREGRQGKDVTGKNESFLITFQQDPYQPIFAFVSPSLSPLWK
jgi:hypothetical protein